MKEIIALDEAERSAALPDDEPHEFIGRIDRDCERCGKPDRNPIHIWPETSPK